MSRSDVPSALRLRRVLNRLGLMLGGLLLIGCLFWTVLFVSVWMGGAKVADSFADLENIGGFDEFTSPRLDGQVIRYETGASEPLEAAILRQNASFAAEHQARLSDAGRSAVSYGVAGILAYAIMRALGWLVAGRAR